MGRLELSYTVVRDPQDEESQALTIDQYQSFNSSILGLGAISHEGDYLEALAAMFDLEGFTTFCNQIDPHLVVPEYLDLFLDWLFKELASQLTITRSDKQVLLWARLPFFAKFLGDGILFLWNTKYANNLHDIGNIVVSLESICESYRTAFLPSIGAEFSRPPSRLRCGIARGQVIPIGNGADYVGSCINMAARLQKLGKLSFAFPRRGFSIAKCFDATYAKKFVAKRVGIRGIGESEIIIVLESEFNALTPQDRADFSNP